MQRRSPLTSRDERGSVLIFVAIVMVLILGFAALAVDLGNARQQHGNAQVAVDGGALAGAYALHDTTGTGCFTDVYCTAAYYTFQSLGIVVGSSLGWATGSCGAGCASYTLDNATVQVRWPYSFHGGDSTQYVHVRSCWDNKNAFAPVIGFPTTKVCASATAQSVNGIATSGSSPPPTNDCPGIDNFADANGKPTIFPAVGSQVKAGTTIGAVFHSPDSSLDLTPGTFDFEAPNAAGTMVTLDYDPTGKTGYKLQPPLPAGGQPYPDQTDVTISYKLPSSLPNKDSSGAPILYQAKLHAQQVLQDPGPNCGNASWTFTADGKAVSASGCGEDSFIASVYPKFGTAEPGEHIGANYTDESPLHWQPWSPSDEFGIKFTLSGPGWTDADGNPTFVPYTLDPPAPPGAKNVKIDYQLPDASKFYAGAVYTAQLKAYDTDNNKPGNDCGQATWTFTVPAGTAGFVRLVE